MKLYVAGGVAAVLILAAGLTQWVWTGYAFAEMTSSERVAQFVRRLENVPMTVGDWDGEDLDPTEARERGVAGIKGEVQRRYVNRRTGDIVNMSIVTGNHYDIAVHVPTQCYVAAGFDQLGNTVRHPVTTEPVSSEFYTTIFKKEDQKTRVLQRIFWTWTADGEWQAPKSPRWAFASEQALYKMYLINQMQADAADSPEDNPAIEFARVMIPALHDSMFVEETASVEGEPQQETDAAATDAAD